jgi:DNA-binding CsgD family transcriptional regulator
MKGLLATSTRALSTQCEQFPIGERCFVPQQDHGSILVALPPSPLLAGLSHVLGVLEVPYVVSLSWTPELLASISLLVCDDLRHGELDGRIDELTRTVLFSDSSPAESDALAVLSPSASTATLLDLASGWVNEFVHSPLSTREREILGLVSQGFSNEEIANACYVSTATVKTHLLRSFRKLGVSDRAAAVYKAVKLGLIV